MAAATHLVPTERPFAQARRRRTVYRSTLVARLGPDRIVAIAVAAVLVGASLVSITAGGPARNTGNTEGFGDGPRIAVGGTGGFQERDDGAIDQGAGGLGGSVEFGSPEPENLSNGRFAAIGPAPEPEASEVVGPYIDDGTLVKPIAVDTSVPDGSELVTTYKVKSGDTLVGIAQKFGVSMMSLWWANDLKSKDDLHIGQVLDIPPVTGLIVTITADDTLESLADDYNVNGEDILATNGLDDSNLVVGQVLVIPGAKGEPIPTPKPKPKPKPTPPPGNGGGGGGGSGGHTRLPATYTGGQMLWPVVGGHNYISQYFHTGHYAIDIAADYGSTVRAAASGTVTFAGWKNNGGGYQVWVAHGSGLYTTYNHMSAITVGRGQHIGRGQQVGRVGQSGAATGPHLHFEVWRGPIWDGGTRVNPLLYL